MKYIFITLLLLITQVYADNKMGDVDIVNQTKVEKKLHDSNLSKEDNKTTNENNLTVEETAESIALKREKLNILIKQFNRFSMGVYRVYPYYERYFGTNPDKYKKSRSGYIVEIFQKLDKSAFERAKKVDILHELDVLIDAYYLSAKEVKKRSNDAYEYYNMKDYKNDKYAKGKQMHKPLLEAYNRFFKVDEVLKNKVETIQDALDEAYFKKLKEQGNEFAYLRGMSLLESKRFLKAVHNKTIKETQLAIIEPLLKQIRQYYNELKAMRDEDEEAYDRIDGSSMYFNALKYYTIAAKDLTFRVKDKKPYSKREKHQLSGIAAWMVKPSVGDVSNKYNKLVEAYNR